MAKEKQIEGGRPLGRASLPRLLGRGRVGHGRGGEGPADSGAPPGGGGGPRAGRATVGGALRAAGRLLLWAFLLLVLARGVGDVLADAERGPVRARVPGLAAG